MRTNETAAVEIQDRSAKPTRLREQIFVWSSAAILFALLLAAHHISGLAHDAYCHGGAPGVAASYQLGFDRIASAGLLALVAVALLTFARTRVWYATLAVVFAATIAVAWILGMMSLGMIWCN